MASSVIKSTNPSGFKLEADDSEKVFGCIALSSEESKHLKAPKGNRCWPIVGETFNFLSDPKTYTQTRYEKYGNIFSTHLMMRPTVWVGDLEISKQLLMKEGRWVVSENPPTMQILLGHESLPNAHGEKHKHMRNLFREKVLGQDKTKTYMDILQELSNQHVELWFQQQEEENNRDYIKAYQNVKQFTFTAGCRIIIGFSFDFEMMKSILNLFESYAAGIFAIPVQIPGSPFAKAMNSKKKLMGIVESHLESVDSDAKGKEEGFTPVIPALKNCKNPETGEKEFTHSELVDNSLALLFAATDSTSNAISAILLLIAYYEEKHGGLFEKLKEEQQVIVSKYGERFTRDIIMDEMPLLKSCIKEAFQIIPPVPGVFRKALSDIQISETEKIPKGYQILCSVLEHDPIDPRKPMSWMDKLDKFTPDRWLTRKLKAQNFGYGVRKCVGYHFAMDAEVPILLSTLLRKGTWQLKDNTEKVPFAGLPFAFPQDGLKIKFIRD